MPMGAATEVEGGVPRIETTQDLSQLLERESDAPIPVAGAKDGQPTVESVSEERAATLEAPIETAGHFHFAPGLTAPNAHLHATMASRTDTIGAHAESVLARGGISRDLDIGDDDRTLFARHAFTDQPANAHGLPNHAAPDFSSPAWSAALYGNLDTRLTSLAQSHGEAGPATRDGAVSADGKYVLIDAAAKDGDGAALLAQLQALGLQNGASFGNMAGGAIAVDKLGALANVADLAFASAAVAVTHAGNVTSEGDRGMHADTARADYDVDGSGITIGVISDSFNALGGMATDKATGDLPNNTTVLTDYFGNDASDEGRAMAQIVHDVAPGAAILFETAYNTQAAFANAIVDLANHGAKIIVDDVTYFGEPVFQDGIIAQAVAQVEAMGVTYVSAAGNSADNGFESAFIGSGYSATVVGRFENFAQLSTQSGHEKFLTVTMPSNTGAYFILDWAQPSISAGGTKGATSDLDLFVYNADGTALSNIDYYSSTYEPPYAVLNNIGGNPKEILYYFNDTTTTQNVNLAVGLHSGAAPADFKIMVLDNGYGLSVANSALNTNIGTVFGHAAAPGAISTGAVYAPFAVNGTVWLENYSSSGPTKIYYDAAGNLLSTPEIRQTPTLLAPDYVQTTVQGFAQFAGTSAAAPHVAAVAALMLQANHDLSHDEILRLLQDTTKQGTDYADHSNATGAGLVQADLAVKAAATGIISVDFSHTVLLGTHLNDTFTGRFAANFINHSIDGGAGTDTLDYTEASYFGAAVAAVNVNVAAGQVQVTYGSLSYTDTFTSIEAFRGGAGNDTFVGGAGNDSFDGGAGNDTFTGGTGNDTYYVDSSNDVIHEVSGSSGGIDTVVAKYSYTLTTDLENLTLQAGAGAINGTGTGTDNRITGNDSANTLKGNGGDDILDGGGGADTLIGGTGNDTYYVDNAGDATTELANEGTDLVRARAGYVLGQNVENLTLEAGAGNIAGTGNSLSNAIQGNEGNNALNGGDGADTLTGGAGADMLTGGAGVDTFVFAPGDTSAVYAQRDVITDFQIGVDKIDLSKIDANTLVAGQDIFHFNGYAGFDGTAGALRLTYNNAGVTMIEGDTNGDKVADFGIGLQSSSWLEPTVADFTAMSVLQAVTLSGDGNANTLTGGVMNDTLAGNGGDDILDGGKGADQMTGGTGNDTYYVDNAGDVVTEQPSEGTDLVRARISYVLGANVENLTLEAGAGNIAGSGNSLANVIIGNEGANTLTGGVGKDTLTGGSDVDTFVFATGDTGATAGTRDLITDFVVGTDKIDLSGIDANTGVAGQDAFRFLGTAAFDGAAGALHTVFDAANNLTVVEGDTNGDGTADFAIALSGNLTLGAGDFTAASLMLPQVLTGDGNANTLTGGAMNDTLTGNGGDDILDGGKGADQMTGGTGNDTYSVDNAGDVVTELANEGTDLVRSRINYTLGANVENLTLETGAGNLSATGNALNNTIIGNDGNNTITGGSGLDTLTGGAGVDTFVFGAGDTSAVYAQRDIITDFTVGTDKIDLSGIDANTLVAGQDAFRFNGWTGFDGAGSLRLTYNNAGLTMIEGDTNGDGVADFGIGLKAASWTEPSTADFTASSLALPVTLTGDGNANTLSGGAMNDTLIGNGGDDILDGGKGADQMTGGTGNDIYFVDNTGDAVTELSGEGTADLVRSRISYTLGANVENLTLGAGAGNLSATGNNLGNVIVGNEGANTLTGGAGKDTLTGGLGADTFIFATGDTGAAAGTRDAITDFQVGVDKLDLSGIDANTLAAGQDAFRFLGTAALDGAAGALHTVFDAANNLTVVEGDTNGDGTADFAIALSGNLTLGAGDFTAASLQLPVTLTGDGNANTLTGGAMNDTLTGNGGDDILDGRGGADQMIGGTGNDTYFVDNAVDGVTELANQGTDLVRTTINYVLGADVENLILETGAGNIFGTGNSLGNTIVGNEGNNTITGGAGLDTLTGGAGVDTFMFATGDTSVVYAQRDIITDFQVGVDKINLTGIDANTLVAGQDLFHFNGYAGFDGTAGALRLTYNNAGLTMIEGDTNGDKVADFGIGLKAVSWLEPTSADFTAGSLTFAVHTASADASSRAAGVLDLSDVTDSAPLDEHGVAQPELDALLNGVGDATGGMPTAGDGGDGATATATLGLALQHPPIVAEADLATLG